MKNLENYGVLEMNTQEIREIEGGIFAEIIAACAILTASYTIGYGIGYAAYELTH